MSVSEGFLDAAEVAQIQQRVSLMGQPPPEMTPRGAFIELQGPEDCGGVRQDLAAIDVEKLSLPSPGFRPGALAFLLPEDPEYVDRFVREHVLLEEQIRKSSSECEVQVPYSDPALRSLKGTWRFFIA